MKYASSPTKNFSTPTGRVLKSMEVMVSLGSSFGIEENSGVLGRLAIGLGGVAEVELTRSSFMNELTGQQGNLPTSIFKMSLVPERFSQYWFIPNFSLQLHSTPWQSSVMKALISLIRQSILCQQSYQNKYGQSLHHIVWHYWQRIQFFEHQWRRYVKRCSSSECLAMDF